MLLRIHWFIYSHDLAEVIYLDPSCRAAPSSTMVASSLALTTVQLVLLLDSPSSNSNRAPVTEDESRPERHTANRCLDSRP
jgi:hypothetical protein